MRPSGRASVAKVAAVVIAASLVLFWLVRLKRGSSAASEDALLQTQSRPSPQKGSEARAKSANSPASPRNARSGAGGPGIEAPPVEDEVEALSPRERAERRMARSRDALDNFLTSARYPPGSRPLREQPDQEKPHSVAERKLPLARADHKLTDAHVLLRQDRYFLSGDEAATFSIECETSDGPAACEILSSVARSQPPSPAAANGAPEAAPAARSTILPFIDGAAPGVKVAVFSPSTQGFEGYYGPINVGLDLRVEGETGRADFDVEYTPAPPATFTGAVREVIEKGSLSLYIGLDIAKAGRYLLAARVDDADGRSFAYLSFNDELPAGRAEAKLVVFGKLILDESAKAPFQLRDLEGFLLKENVYPDRELIPGKDGPVYKTKAYTTRDFSDSEWQSEEKERQLTQLRGEVEEAQKALDQSGEP